MWGLAGMTRSTYRSPNSVVGSISAVTFAGIWETMPGWIASCSRAPVPLAEICRTSPTCTPRTITSAPGCISLPTLSVYSVTVAAGVNCLLYRATDSQTSRAKTSRNTTPTSRYLVLSCTRGQSHPATRTVVVAPQIARLMKKSMMLIITMAVRTARPTATPTPAGPPLARYP